VDDDSPNLPPDIGTAHLIAQWRRLRERAAAAQLTGVEASGGGGYGIASISLSAHGQGSVAPPELAPAVGNAAGGSSAQAEGSAAEAPPEVALAFALLDLGGRTREGDLIVAVRPAWTQILEELERDPHALQKLSARQAEELVAGGWRDHGWQVTLTPRSGDGGVDIIATRRDLDGAIRILDQVKRYKPGHLVTAEDVRAMWGVLDADRRASKAYVTTTSGFAPGIECEFADRMPSRIELRDGAALREWLRRRPTT